MAKHREKQTLRRSGRLASALGLLLNLIINGTSCGAPFTVSDPIGDNFGAPHDAIEISGSFDANNVYLVAKFDALDPNNLGFLFGLDIDENSLTGNQFGSPIGMEFSVFYVVGDNAGQAVLGTTSGEKVGMMPVDFSANMLSVTVPRSLLNDDGPLNFGFISGIPDDILDGFTPYDRVPNNILDGPLVGPIGFVPEPTSLLMFFYCLPLALATGRAFGRCRSRLARPMVMTPTATDRTSLV